MDDELIVPGRPRRPRHGIRKMVDVPATSAPIFELGEGSLVVIEHKGDITGMNFLAPGRYIILSLEKWVTTLNKSVQVTQEIIEQESRQVRRAQRRAIAQDRHN